MKDEGAEYQLIVRAYLIRIRLAAEYYLSELLIDTFATKLSLMAHHHKPEYCANIGYCGQSQSW